MGTAAATLVLLGGLTACGSDDGAGGACDEPTVKGTAKKDVLRGTPGRDVIAGYGGNDRLFGLGGDDVLCGGDGKDRLEGGPGNDELHGGRNAKEVIDTEAYDYYGDVLAGGPGDDLLDVGVDDRQEVVDGEVISWQDSPAGIQLDAAKGIATGEGKDRITVPAHGYLGSRFDDRMLGSDQGEIMFGNAGRDHLSGLGGNDTLGSGTDQSTGNQTDRTGDTLLGGDGEDQLSGAAGDDQLDGGAGQDSLHGAFGQDRLFGGPGDDQLLDSFFPGEGQVLDGGPGQDVLGDLLLYPRGKTGADDALIRGVTGTFDLAAGTMRARAGSATYAVPALNLEGVTVTYGAWTLLGSAANDEFIGGNDDQGPSTIDGRGGDDQVMGTFGFDTLTGGPGKDTLIKTPGGDKVSGFEDLR